MHISFYRKQSIIHRKTITDTENGYCKISTTYYKVHFKKIAQSNDKPYFIRFMTLIIRDNMLYSTLPIKL